MGLIAFVDIETLGLDPDRHAVWEAALVLLDADAWEVVAERRWMLELTAEQIADADPRGVEISGFTTRYEPAEAVPVPAFLVEFIALTERAHLAGAVVSFDEERLRRLARHHGLTPGWHYHLIDVETVAIGALAARGIRVPLPWESHDLSNALGVELTWHDRHTALGDARWALRLLTAATKRVGGNPTDTSRRPQLWPTDLCEREGAPWIVPLTCDRTTTGSASC